MTKLRRFSLTAYQAPLCETIVENPEPKGSEVLVRIERCGVCHSDLHMQDGYFALGEGNTLDVRAGRTLPFTLGHEIAGVVERAGPDAAGAKAGAKVAVYPWIGCGQCAACKNGDENLCTTNRHLGVSADGELAACHRFVGDEEGGMGSLDDGVDLTRQADWLAARHVHRQEPCQSCWARYLCGGGCHHEVISRGRPACDYIRGWLHYCLEAYLRLSSEPETAGLGPPGIAHG